MSLFLNGVMNQADPWFGFPFHTWALVLWWLIVIPVTWFLLKRVMWDPYIVFHGLHYAKKNASSACLITDDSGDTAMVAEHIAKCIFAYGDDDYTIEIPALPLSMIKSGGIIAAILGVVVVFTGHIVPGILLIVLGVVGYCIEMIVPWVYSNVFWYPTQYLPDIDWQKAILYKIGRVNFDCKIAQHLQNGEWDQYPVVNCGGILVEMVFDSNHWCERRTRQHKAIVKSAREWNKENPKDQVHTYVKYQRYLDNGKIIAPAEINVDYLVPWVRIDAGYPFDIRNVEDSGKRRQMAKTKESKVSGEVSKWTWILLIAAFLVLILILGVRIGFRLLFGATPK